MNSKIDAVVVVVGMDIDAAHTEAWLLPLEGSRMPNKMVTGLGRTMPWMLSFMAAVEDTVVEADGVAIEAVVAEEGGIMVMTPDMPLLMLRRLEW